jgi:ribonuclease HIII
MFNHFQKGSAQDKLVSSELGPKPKTLYTIELSEQEISQLKTYLEKNIWEPYTVEHAAYAYKGDRVNVVAYKSGKVVIQGKKTEDFVRYVIEGEITKMPQLGYEAILNPEWFEAHAGLDESGKGDLFGPVVSACVIADGPMVQSWLDAGLKDSKKITSDAAILKLEKIIRSTNGVVIGLSFASMPKYNELYKKFSSNMNKLLAWLHAKALEEALRKKRVPWALLDQFSKQPLVQKYFKDDPIDLRMRTKAESDPVVAAASVIARATYIHQMQKLSQSFGEKLSKGVNAKVKEQAKAIVQKWGPEVLGNYAKLHFRTSYEILGLPVPEKAKMPY